MNITKMQENRRREDRELRDAITTQAEADRLALAASMLRWMADLPREYQLRVLTDSQPNFISLVCELACRKCAEILLDWESKKQAEGN